MGVECRNSWAEKGVVARPSELSRVAAAFLPAPALEPVRVIARKVYRRANFPLLDRRGRRERLSLIASGGVVDKLMPRSAPYCFGA